ncbi:hypothetical protein DITRI_Ditri12bG0005600 [Diplodiscus trichospermus]
MKSSRHHNSSYLWLNLLEGKQLVEAGSLWKVGDGLLIDAWNDKWLPKPPTFKPVKPVGPEPTCFKVNSLLVADRRQWDIEKIKSFSSPEDATLIQQIPLSNRVNHDKVYWLDSTVGELPVKSAYVAARRILGKRVLDLDDRVPIWCDLWTACVPPSVKYFFWRSLRTILPTCSNLQSRHLQINNQCCVCGKFGETLDHIFFHCEFSSSIWLQQRGIRSPPIQASWCPPPLHFVKLNVDASYEVGTDVAKIGVVLGNHDGLVLLSAVTMISGIVSVLHTELQAILFGGEVVLEGDYPSILIESDSLQAVTNSKRGAFNLCFEPFGFSLTLLISLLNLKFALLSMFIGLQIV